MRAMVRGEEKDDGNEDGTEGDDGGDQVDSKDEDDDDGDDDNDGDGDKDSDEEEDGDDGGTENKDDSGHDHIEVSGNSQKSFSINVEQENNQEEIIDTQHRHHHRHHHPKRSADNANSQKFFEAEPKDLNPENLPGSSRGPKSVSESDPSFKIMETLVDKFVEEQITSLEEALTKVTQNLVESKEFDQFE
ncbi:hypothetical protein BGZ79_002700 [Entomortierella chlamydospora]|nr:hypothetical protein BGZ79_002700 [Entomortierella chlamydospora]